MNILKTVFLRRILPFTRQNLLLHQESHFKTKLYRVRSGISIEKSNFCTDFFDFSKNILRIIGFKIRNGRSLVQLPQLGGPLNRQDAARRST